MPPHGLVLQPQATSGLKHLCEELNFAFYLIVVNLNLSPCGQWLFYWKAQDRQRKTSW